MANIEFEDKINQMPLESTWADGTSNKQEYSELEVSTGIEVGGLVSSTQLNSAFDPIGQNVQYAKCTGGYFDPNQPYLEGQVVIIYHIAGITANYNEIKFRRTALDSGMAGYYPIINATTEDKKGIIYYRDGTHNIQYWELMGVGSHPAVGSAEHIEKYEMVKYKLIKNNAKRLELLNAGFYPIDGTVLQKATYSTKGAYIPEELIEIQDETTITLKNMCTNRAYLRLVASNKYADDVGIGSSTPVLPNHDHTLNSEGKTVDAGLLAELSLENYNGEKLAFGTSNTGTGDIQTVDANVANKNIESSGELNSSSTDKMQLYDRQRDLTGTTANVSTGDAYKNVDPLTNTNNIVAPESFYATPLIFVGQVLNPYT